MDEKELRDFKLEETVVDHDPQIRIDDTTLRDGEQTAGVDRLRFCDTIGVYWTHLRLIRQ